MSPFLRSTTVRQLINALGRDGWTWDRATGSHRVYAKGALAVTVHYYRPGATLPPKTRASIVALARWTADDLRRLKLLK